jgi:hypothetical protein
LGELKNPSHTYHSALSVLADEPRRQTVWRRLFTPALARDVQALLGIVQRYHPSLVHDLNSATVAEWNAYLSSPRHSAWALWSFVLTPFALGAFFFFVLTPQHPAWAAFSLLVPMVAVMAILRMYLFAMPRMVWRRHPEWQASNPIRFGWAPTSCLMLAGAAVLPENSAVLATLGLLSAATGLWAAITGELDVRDGKYPWLGRMVMVQAYLVIWWAFISREIPPYLFLQMTLTFTSAIVVSCFGTMPLFRLWLSILQTRGRILSLIGLGLLVAGTGYLLWLAHGQPAFKPLAAAAVAITVLLHRIPALGLPTGVLKIRHYTMWFLGIALLNLGTPSGFGLLSIGGAWLLIGVVITVVGGLASMKSD